MIVDEEAKESRLVLWKVFDVECGLDHPAFANLWEDVLQEGHSVIQILDAIDGYRFQDFAISFHTYLMVKRLLFLLFVFVQQS